MGVNASPRFSLLTSPPPTIYVLICTFLCFFQFLVQRKAENVKLFCDAGNQTVSRGEFQHLFAKSGMKESEFVSRFTPEIGNKLKKLLLEEMVTLDEILMDNKFGGIMKLSGRLRGNAGLTVFDTSGVAAQDAKIAALIG